MLSNVSKSSDSLRGNTQMQDLWEAVEKESPVRTRRAPKVLDNDVYIGKVANVKERRGDVELEAMVRQQHTNFFMSESAQTLRERKSRLPAAERKSIRQRLTRAPSHLAPRTKSPTNLGHLMRNGDHSVNSPDRPDAVSPKATPKSKAKISPISSRRQPALRFQGLSTTEFFHEEWTPSLKYRPAQQVEPWQPLDGFSQSTRTLERRKLDPFTDINSYTGNYASAKAQYNSHAHVRSLDVKGQLGAGTLQRWKETLREDFARDNDNYSTNAHDAFLDDMRVALAHTSSFSTIK